MDGAAAEVTALTPRAQIRAVLGQDPRTLGAPVPARGTPPSVRRGDARVSCGRELARAAVVLPESFPSSHRPRVGMATGQPVPEQPSLSAPAAATAGAGARAYPMMHRASPVPSGPPCCRSER